MFPPGDVPSEVCRFPQGDGEESPAGAVKGIPAWPRVPEPKPVVL